MFRWQQFTTESLRIKVVDLDGKMLSEGKVHVVLLSDLFAVEISEVVDDLHIH